MEKKTYLKIVISAISVFVFLATTPYFIHAADLYFAPSSGNFTQNENFTVSVLVNTEKSINAVSGTVTFATEYLEVIAVSIADSIIGLWIKFPSFSNATNIGNVHFEGIILNPGYLGPRGRIVDIVFGIKKIGLVNLAFKESSVLANDGEGSNVTSSLGSAIFTFTEPQSSITTPKEENNSVLEKKIEDIAKKLNLIIESPQRTPTTVIIQKQEPARGILGFWEIFPNWIKASILFFMGIATIIFLFVIVGLGVIILIWFWGQIRYKGVRIAQLLISRTIQCFKRFISYLGMAEKEMKGDIAYSVRKLEEEFQNARQAPSFKELFINYWFVLGSIIRRFFTKNEDDNLKK